MMAGGAAEMTWRKMPLAVVGAADGGGSSGSVVSSRAGMLAVEIMTVRVADIQVTFAPRASEGKRTGT